MGFCIKKQKAIIPLWAALLFNIIFLNSAHALCDMSYLDLRWPGGKARFLVEIADDAPERNRGLMFRESMPRDSGMLFVYDTPGNPVFWMKNTLISLDILFIDAQGQVVRIHPSAKPLDITPIGGVEGVQFVLEINGGLTESLRLPPTGALIRHPLIPEAIWSCKLK